MKRIIFILGISFLGFFNITCDNEDDNVATTDANWVVMTNGFDPLIASASSNSGTVVDFFGERNQSGVPTNIDQVVVKTVTDTTVYKLDEIGRPMKIITQNGTQFNFSWISEKEAAVVIATPDGKNQINTQFDFEVPTKPNFERKINLSRNGKLSLTYSSYSTTSNFKKDFASGNVTISTKACDALSDADEVNLVIKDKSFKTLAILPTTRTDKGKYMANIPTTSAPVYNPTDVCSSISNLLNNIGLTSETVELIKNNQETLCSNLTSSLALTGIEGAAAAEIFASCQAATSGIREYCRITSPNLRGSICNATLLNRTFSEDEMVIFAKAKSIADNSSSQSLNVTANGPFPNLDVNFNSGTAIKNVDFVPSSPRDGADYNATFNITCLTAGSVVNFTVVGTDGFTDNISYNVSTDNPEGVFKLSAPWPQSLVYDKIIAEITLPNGSTVTKTASLIFE